MWFISFFRVHCDTALVRVYNDAPNSGPDALEPNGDGQVTHKRFIQERAPINWHSSLATAGLDSCCHLPQVYEARHWPPSSLIYFIVSPLCLNTCKAFICLDRWSWARTTVENTSLRCQVYELGRVKTNIDCIEPWRSVLVISFVYQANIGKSTGPSKVYHLVCHRVQSTLHLVRKCWPLSLFSWLVDFAPCESQLYA